jgi:hypothetical protein
MSPDHKNLVNPGTQSLNIRKILSQGSMALSMLQFRKPFYLMKEQL